MLYFRILLFAAMPVASTFAQILKQDESFCLLRGCYWVVQCMFS